MLFGFPREFLCGFVCLSGIGAGIVFSVISLIVILLTRQQRQSGSYRREEAIETENQRLGIELLEEENHRLREQSSQQQDNRIQ